jgi:hypothetical protein
MKTWEDRPIEIRNLFNPAFCGVILQRALKGFEEIDTKGMPYSLSLLVLPLSLHMATRRTIAAHPRTHLLSTIEANPHLRVDFDSRVRDLLPFTHEAFGLLAQHGCIAVSDDGTIRTIEKSLRSTITGTPESRSCQRVARTVGREFAHIGDRATVYTTLGIRP